MLDLLLAVSLLAAPARDSVAWRDSLTMRDVGAIATIATEAALAQAPSQLGRQAPRPVYGDHHRTVEAFARWLGRPLPQSGVGGWNYRVEIIQSPWELRIACPDTMRVTPRCRMAYDETVTRVTRVEAGPSPRVVRVHVAVHVAASPFDLLRDVVGYTAVVDVARPDHLWRPAVREVLPH